MIVGNKNFYSIVFFVLGIALATSANGAAVVSRAKRTNTSSGTVVSRKLPSSDKVTEKSITASDLIADRIEDKSETESKSDSKVSIKDSVASVSKNKLPKESIITENKSSLFDNLLSESTVTKNDTEDSVLAAQIRAQRNALDARDATEIITKQAATIKTTGKNACDTTLRTCMQSKCGQDYSKCAGDTDTTWGDKMDSCRRDTKCTGHEYAIFAPEIKADRDMNARIAQYTSIVNCGNKYNNCIIEKCGTTFTKCLGKSAGDKAIQDCSKIAKECQEQDSGLASRMMGAFGTLRQDAEKQIVKDEQALYDLRDEMANTCKRLGAMFDERTLDCVYTVNLYAGEDNTLYASKKLYAGSTFNCEPNWFGIDITTFMENAFRLTREQTAASSAMLGAGLGIGVGAVTSGAIERAVERTKAENALKKAEKANEDASDDTDSSDSKKTKKEKRKADRAATQAEKEQCKKDGGKWKNGKCEGKTVTGNTTPTPNNAPDEPKCTKECETKCADTNSSAYDADWCYDECQDCDFYQTPEQIEETNDTCDDDCDKYCINESLTSWCEDNCYEECKEDATCDDDCNKYCDNDNGKDWCDDNCNGCEE